MMIDWADLIWNRWRPREGWLLLGLLFALVTSLGAAVAEVDWVPGDSLAGWGLAGGLVMGVWLAKRPSSAIFSWVLIGLYAVTSTAVWAGDLWPDVATWRAGWPGLSQFWRQNGALFLDRMGSWLHAAVSGGSSQETVFFLWGMGLAAWLVAAFAAWSVYRWRQPLWGVTAVGVIMGLNSYFGQRGLTWLVLFVGLSVLLTAVSHCYRQEMGWQRTGVDYSDEVRLDLYFHAGGAALVLMAAVMLLPSLSWSRMAQVFQEMPWVAAFEERLADVFAGVAQPGRGTFPDSPGGVGTMPRAFLLGDPPELYDTVVMTAVVTQDGAPVPFEQIRGTHWRGLSYDVYTGRGWALSAEREEAVAANELIDLPVASGTAVRQTVNWQFDQRSLRYTLGLPSQFTDPVTVSWRGLDDLSRVSGGTGAFTAVSYLNQFSPDFLRQSLLADVPPVLLARYTALPDSVPGRVAQLAQDVAGDLSNPYDQAVALEQFLRQYPYSLNVPLPPENGDPVDFFLFDLQMGYCDYYASAMVVMARSLGLPARLVVGYLPQPADADGVQRIAQINGHSWAEVYFAGAGWVEFEPTAAFASPHQAQTSLGTAAATIEDEPVSPPPPIPEASPAAPALPGWRAAGVMAGLTAVVIAAWFWRRRRTAKPGETVQWVYGRVQAIAPGIGHSAHPSQTPAEFTREMVDRIRPFAQQIPRLASRITPLSSNIERLGRLYARHQYSPHKSGGGEEAMGHWRQMRLPLQILRIVTILRREKREREGG